jgi:chaperonin GroES
MENNIIPLYDKILVEKLPLKNKETASGIVLTGSEEGKSRIFKVLAVGCGRLMTDGKIVPLLIKSGDFVVCADYAGISIDDTRVVVGEAEVLGRTVYNK